MVLYGRRRIYTDEKEITAKNVIQVLQKSLEVHWQNASEMKFLLEYEKGNQPLIREKKIRADINIEVCDNLANEITEFKLGYNWGNQITYVQRADKDLSGNKPEIDNAGISILNEMLEAEYSASADQELARYIEICGVGAQMVDIKRDYDGGSVFDLVTLNPLCSFVVYDNTILHRPVMGVAFRTLENGNTFYTCFTPKERFEIKNIVEIVKEEEKERWDFRTRSGEANPLGKVPIVEFVRSPDRMGCFERQISDLDNLNILVSDFTNNVAQDTQALWWGNDFDFPKDEKTGEVQTPRSGQWVMTYSGEGKQPKIQPLIIQTQYEGILSDIKYRREVIKQKCAVPMQTEPGGGSTGTAMSMSSGWQNAEVAACKEAQLIAKGKMQIADLLLQAIKKSPDTPVGSPLLNLKISDIKPSIIRNKTYDMATKSNTYATWVAHGIHPRHAIQQVEAFPDPNLVYEDSIPYTEKYLESIFSKESGGEEKKQSDLSDQLGNSPILDGINTDTNAQSI